MVDDLDRKPWLGDTRKSTFDGLRGAFGCAVALRDSGLELRGRTDARQGRRNGASPRGRYTVALFPFVGGHAGRHFKYDAADERAAVVTMLAQVHAATSAIRSRCPCGRSRPARSRSSRIRTSGSQRDLGWWAVLGTRPASAGRTRLRCGRLAGPIRPTFSRRRWAQCRLGHHAWRAPSTKRHAIGRELQARRLGRGGAGPARARFLDARGR